MAVEFVTIKVWAKTLAKLKKLAYLEDRPMAVIMDEIVSKVLKHREDRK